MNSKKFDQIWLMIWPYLLFIVCITIMAFPQLMAGVVTKGGDTYFHYTRFYDTAMQMVKYVHLLTRDRMHVFIWPGSNKPLHL